MKLVLKLLITYLSQAAFNYLEHDACFMFYAALCTWTAHLTSTCWSYHHEGLGQ